MGSIVGFMRPYNILQSGDMDLIAGPGMLGSLGATEMTLKCFMKPAPTTTF